MGQRRVALFLAVGLSACGSAPETETSVSKETDSILFSDQFSDTGRLQVFETPEGFVAFTVRGAIGIDDVDFVSNAFRQSTLLETYKALKPEASTTPDEIIDASERLDQQKRVSRTSETLEQAASAAELSDSSTLQDKNYASFVAATCKDFNGSFGYWDLKSCRWTQSGTNAYTTVLVNLTFGSFAWNETNGEAWHQVSTTGQNTYTLPAWYYQWGSWYYPTPLSIMINSDETGSVGVTAHQWISEPH